MSRVEILKCDGCGQPVGEKEGAWSFTGEEWAILDDVRARRAQKEPSA